MNDCYSHIGWIRSLKQIPAKWSRRSRLERYLLLEAFIFLCLARLALLFFPFRWLARTLGRHMHESERAMGTETLNTARMVGSAIRSAANYTPWESVCLPQAVAAMWMIKRRNIPGTLYMGVRKEGSGTGRLTAHAWVRCGNAVITGAKGHLHYTVVSAFS